MAIQITADTMTLKIDNRVVATARFSERAATDGNGAWIVSAHLPAFIRCQAITALTVAELGESAYASRRNHRVPRLSVLSLDAWELGLLSVNHACHTRYSGTFWGE